MIIQQVRLTIFLVFIGCVMFVAHSINAFHIVDHKCKLGVTGLFVPTTLYLAHFMYKKEMFEFYKKNVADKGKLLTFRQNVRKYNNEFSYKAFLMAYGRYLKEAFSGSIQWKNDNKLFCALVQNFPIFLIAVTGIDYYFLKNIKQPVPLQPELPVIKSDKFLDAQELRERTEQESIENSLTPEELCNYQNMVQAVSLMSQQTRNSIINRLTSSAHRQRLLDFMQLNMLQQQNNLLGRNSQQPEDQLTPEEDRVYQEQLALYTRGLADQGYRLINPRWERNFQGEIRLRFEYEQDRSLIQPIFGPLLRPCEPRVLCEEGCGVCLEGKLDEIKDLQAKLIVEEAKLEKDVETIQKLKEGIAAGLALKSVYVFPCEETGCWGGRAVCATCVAGLCSGFYASCPRCKKSLR